MQVKKEFVDNCLCRKTMRERPIYLPPNLTNIKI